MLNSTFFASSRILNGIAASSNFSKFAAKRSSIVPFTNLLTENDVTPPGAILAEVTELSARLAVPIVPLAIFPELIAPTAMSPPLICFMANMEDSVGPSIIVEDVFVVALILKSFDGALEFTTFPISNLMSVPVNAKKKENLVCLADIVLMFRNVFYFKRIEGIFLSLYMLGQHEGQTSSEERDQVFEVQGFVICMR